MRAVGPWALLLLSACALSERTAVPDGGSGDPEILERRGTPACQRWQDAYCDFAADRCGVLDRGLCDLQGEGVVCLEDRRADLCVDVLANTSCTVVPVGCEVYDVADPEPAVELCEQYFLALCESNVRCQLFDSVEECLDYPFFDFDCRRALSITLDFEPCVEQLEVRACDAAVPICDEVVRAY